MIAVGASLRLHLAAYALGWTSLLLNLQHAKWNNYCTCWSVLTFVSSVPQVFVVLDMMTHRS